MSDTRHPFSSDRISVVADEHGVATGDVDEALTSVQEAIARDDGEYEYSSRHNFGWRDGDAYYLYGDGIWDRLREDLSLSDSLAAAARDVHRRTMMASAEARGEREAVEEMLADGTEPLVVTDTAQGPPLYGQDV